MPEDRTTPFPQPSTSRGRPWSAGSRERHERILDHARRCSRLRPLAPGEDAALVAAFLAGGRGVTLCPPAYLLPVSGVEASTRDGVSGTVPD